MEEFFLIYTATRRYCINLIDSINQKYELLEQMLSSININDGKEKINNIYEEINKIYPKNEIIDDSIRVDIIKVILVKIETIDPEEQARSQALSLRGQVPPDFCLNIRSCP